MCGPYKRAYDERSGLAKCVKRSKLDPHRKKAKLSTTRLSVYQKSVRAVVVVRLSLDSGKRNEMEKG